MKSKNNYLNFAKVKKKKTFFKSCNSGFVVFRPTPLLNLTLAVPVDGGVQNMTSQPKGTW